MSRSERRSRRSARGSGRLAVGVGLALATLLLWASPAWATWSIVATDPETGEVGAVIASCVPGEVLGSTDAPLLPVVLQPGRSVAVTQGQLNLDAPARIRELTAAGATPSEIIGDLSSADFDEVAALRQHAIAALDGEVAGFTGAETSPSSLDAQALNVSVQGNLLVSDAVVDDALASFAAERRAGTTLAAALVEGLVAGADAGGDRRCGEQTALFAQLVVAGPDDEPDAPATLLTVVVDQGDGTNPVEILERAFVDGDRGLVDAGSGDTSSGAVVRLAVLIAAVLMVVVGWLVFRRGIGSVRARR